MKLAPLLVASVSLWFAPGLLGPQVSDVLPPHLAGLSFSPTTVDTAYGAQTITVTAHLTDDLSGIFGSGSNSGTVSRIVLASPSGSQHATANWDATSALVSGTRGDGYFAAPLKLPRYCEAGTWQIESVFLADQVGNSRSLSLTDVTALGFPTDVLVTSNEDAEPPHLASYSFLPASVNVGLAAQTVTVTVRITDDLSGVSTGTGGAAATIIQFSSPSNTQSVSATIPSGSDLVTGTALDGTWRKRLTIPRHAQTGVWTLSQVVLVDEAGNARTLSGFEWYNNRPPPPAFSVNDVVYKAYLPSVSGPRPTPILPCPTDPLPAVDWDPRLGNGTQVLPHLESVQLVPAVVQHCQTYWRVTRVKFEDVSESGNDHTIYVKVLGANGLRVSGQVLHLTSVGGLSEYPEERPDGDLCDCNFQYPLYGDGYHVQIASALPSDKVTGMIMPMRRHVNYRITFQQVVNPQ